MTIKDSIIVYPQRNVMKFDITFARVIISRGKYVFFNNSPFTNMLDAPDATLDCKKKNGNTPTLRKIQ